VSPRRSRLALFGIAVGTILATSLVTRLVLLGMQRASLADGLGSVVRALLVGEWYDFVVALWLALPIALVLALAPGGRASRVALRVLLALTALIAVFVAVAEPIFFDEFNGRFNFVAVDYLLFPTEVVTNIWESYPLAWLLAGIAVVAAIVVLLLRQPLRDALAHRVPSRERLAFGAAYLAVLAVLTLVTTPSFARVSEDRALNEVASNGYYTFWQALLGQDAPYEGLYATRPASAIAPRLRRLVGASDSATAAASVPAGATPTARFVRASRPERRLNVVIVLEESLGANFVSAIHPRDSLPIAPSFDSLASEGTLLTRAFSTGNRTIRALEATTASIPPLPGISIVRRPQSRDLFTLPNVLRAHGYATEFIYGGRALFDGMRTYMRNNGMERIVEQGDFPSDAFKTAWGVSDEYIFDGALAQMDSLHRAGRPFYTLILSVSNHKPYTYPKGRIPQNPDEHRRTFAVRYADWALGRFMRMARTHAFFDNTIFVLMGDHGARVYGAAEIPLPSYEVPVVFYAPGIIPAGRRVDTMVSSLDIPPTVLSLLGLSYESKFFGRDIFAMQPDEGRAVMTHNSELALMRDGRMAVLGLREATTLYAVDSAGTLTRIVTPDSSGHELIEDAIALFNGADRIYRSGEYRFTGTRTAKR
jgi:phosphoglycerol transferase MdoB-like AlkP superfamily enzyme